MNPVGTRSTASLISSSRDREMSGTKWNPSPPGSEGLVTSATSRIVNTRASQPFSRNAGGPPAFLLNSRFASPSKAAAPPPNPRVY